MPVKVWLPLTLIVIGVSCLAVFNLKNMDYFFPVNELPDSGDSVYENVIKVKGRIVPGTIIADKDPITFTIAEEETELVVKYVGEEPLPDMFKDRAETVVTGTMQSNGVFHAEHVQAKCASKYEGAAPSAEDGYYETEATTGT